MKLSVAMIVKNEEEMLGACIASVEEADEIIICDTGSIDKTLEVIEKLQMLCPQIKSFTDYTWNDNFAEARNHALAKCTGDWVLTIDADDTLEPGGIEKIRDIIAKHPEQLCFNVQYKATTGTHSHKIPVLYKKCKEVYWKGAIHNHLSVAATIDAGVVINFGYSPAHKLDPDRAFRILKKEVEANRTAPRNMYYLAREYSYKYDWIHCLYWADEHLKYGKWALELADAHLLKARSLWHLQRGEEARDACLQAIKYNTNFREALLFMSEMVGEINRENWLWMAEVADNSKLLFTREKTEKPAAYYEKIYAQNPEGASNRYGAIYAEVGAIVGKRTMLDIGCGQGKLSGYIKNYDGFDMAANPYLVADIYTHDYGDYDVYVLLEVLEHLQRDMDVLRKVPSGSEVLFSVPSFDDPSHLRMFTENIVRWRYRDLIDYISITRFNFDSKEQKWRKDITPTKNHILLCRGKKKPQA